LGVEPDFFAIKSWALQGGEYFHAEDVRRSARVVLLGWQVARDLYGDQDPVGERLFINRVPFEVAGVLAQRGQGLDVINEDQQVYVPLTTAMRRLLNVDHYRSILLEVKDSQDMARVAADATALLRARHRISAFRPDDFSVGSQQELIETLAAPAGSTFWSAGLASAGCGRGWAYSPSPGSRCATGPAMIGTRRSAQAQGCVLPVCL
jgi:putative ABC transport system permease protein